MPHPADACVAGGDYVSIAVENYAPVVDVYGDEELCVGDGCCIGVAYHDVEPAECPVGDPCCTE